MIHVSHCDSCALDGFTTPARHTVNELHLCTPCLRDAHTFAGYSAWSFETKLARINCLIDHLDTALQTRKQDREEEAYTDALAVIGW